MRAPALCQAIKERERDAAARAEAARRSLLVGAGGPTAKPDGKEPKPSLDAMVARAYAERLAKAGKAPTDAQEASAGPAAASTGAGGGAPQHTVFDELFASVWQETSVFPGVNPATGQPFKPVIRQTRSLVLPLALPEAGDAAEADKARSGAKADEATLPKPSTTPHGSEAEAGSFVEALSHCVCKQSTARTWCAEQSKYRMAKMTKALRTAPRAMWLTTAALPVGTMEGWEASHDGKPWLPPSFHLELPAATAESEVVAGETAAAATPAAAGTAKPDAAAETVEAARPTITLEPPAATGSPAGGVRERYTLRALISFSQSVLPHASEGSGHLVLFFRVPTMKAAPPQPEGPAADDSAMLGLASDLMRRAIAAALRDVHGGSAPMSADAPAPAASPLSTGAALQAGAVREAEMVPCPTPREMAEHFDGEGQWYSWNDFALHPLTEAAVLRAHSEWKRPCVALYTLDHLSTELADLPLEPDAPVASAAELSDEFSLSMTPTHDERLALSFTPLTPRELPVPTGSLVAIDAEFVAVTREITRTDPRGRTVVVKPARLALARVSCVRGEGPLAGVPFIDSYIQQAEPVIDYLTRFSGLLPGDLDPSVSRHHIETMKAAYVKLRQLIDAGVRFVGHGLKTDFEMINVVIPRRQVIDTVDLFWIEGMRRISLRFLAWHVLGESMSNRLHDTHDSIEDARTALALYNKYRELEAKGLVDETIMQLYDIGRETQWEVPDLP